MDDTIEKRARSAQKRVSEAVTASDFGGTAGGKLILDYINDRVSTLLTKMTAAAPLDDRAYLAHHGAIRELQNINSMLQFKASQLVPAKEELDALRPDTSSKSTKTV